MPAEVRTLINEKKLFKLASRGLSQRLIADGLGISRTALQKYLRIDPALQATYKRGQAQDVQDVVDALKTNAVDKNNVVAQIFYLKNKDPDNWQDKRDVQHSGSLTVNVDPFGAVKDIDGECEDITDVNERLEQDSDEHQ